MAGILAASNFDSAPGSSLSLMSGGGGGGSGSFHQSPGKRTRSSDAPVQLCGMRLLEAVRGICGGYFSGYSRRSDPSMTLSLGNTNTI
jgi:hypothetical protein